VAIASPTPFASDQYDSLTEWGRPAPATAVKKIGNTATAIVVCADDAAQSYIAHARSSRRWSPSFRSNRFDDSSFDDRCPERTSASGLTVSARDSLVGN